jgi:catechol 2,3-dioxygenase-like lactoylglutathione lyase family enzyme
LINELGGIRQLAFVVKDAQAAMRQFIALGVGPFYVVADYVPDDYWYQGKSLPGPKLTLCFAQAGALQIEIIEQHDEQPSAYRSFLKTQEGPQHMALWFATPEAYAAARQRLLQSGLKIIHENGDRTNLARFAYFATDLPGGLMMEIAEALTPNVRSMFELVEQASRQWNGEEPIRHFG